MAKNIPRRSFLYSISINAAQLAMIPGNNLFRLNSDNHPFRSLCGDHLASVIIQWAGISLKNNLTYTLNGFAVVIDSSAPLDLDATQFFVTYSCLHKASQPVISSQIDRLLRFCIRP